MSFDELVITTPTIRDWVVGIRRPDGDEPQAAILLLHGWTGDERSMGIFFPKFPPRVLLIAPRGLYPAETGGYSWVESVEKKRTHYRQLVPAVESLLELMSIPQVKETGAKDFGVVGFSQGAALAFTLALLHPDRVNKVAGLSGFMPAGIDKLVSERPLVGKKAYIAHGTHDEILPISFAREATQTLQAAGADVEYCEAEVGHKLGAACSRGLQEFFDQ